MPADQPTDRPSGASLQLRLQKVFEHGSQRAAKGDLDYAVEMFQQCVQGDSSNLIYLQNFLEVLRKKYNNNKTGDKMARLKGSGLRSQVRKAISGRNWQDAISVGTEMLKLNPWDTPTLQALAEACEHLGFDECQLVYLRAALMGDAMNVDVNRQCAKALTKRGIYDQAIVCWHRVEQVKPHDEEARTAIADLSVERTANKGNPAIAIKKETTERKVTVQLTREQELERDLKDNPALLDNYIELADLYQKADKLDRAEITLKKGLAASGGELRFRERLEEIVLLFDRRRLVIAERKAKESPTQIHLELAKKIKQELLVKELEYYRTRSERYPGRLEEKFELAVRLKKAGNYAEAIPLLQAVAENESLKGNALLELGECHQYQKQYQPAFESYRAAIKVFGEGHPEGLKMALYRAGVLALGLKNVELAEKYLKLLAARDPKYRDLPERLDKLEQLRHKE